MKHDQHVNVSFNGGQDEIDAGYFYAPYVPLQKPVRIADVEYPESSLNITPQMMIDLTEQFSDTFKSGEAYLVAHNLMGSTCIDPIADIGFAYDPMNQCVAFTFVCLLDDDDIKDVVSYFSDNPFDFCLTTWDEKLDLNIKSCYIHTYRNLSDRGYSITINIPDEAIQDGLFTIGENDVRHYFI